ncbi:MAG: MoaD/ThiS family protein [Deltaproteobacteria bacterium]|nr:MoaD/ThiS family protein [Deltaproteobacteria bacterium]
MALKVFLSSTLRQYFPGYDSSEGARFSVNRKTTVSELCKLMNIPEAKIKIVMVNGKSESFDYELQGDERVGLFPPVGGG